MGILFESEEEASGFESVIKRLSGFKDDLFGKTTKKVENEKQNNEKLKVYYDALKEKFGKKKYDENYTEDGIIIYKHNNLKSLSVITSIIPPHIYYKLFLFKKKA